MSESTASPVKRIASSVKLGEGTSISEFTNLYGCEIGDHTKVGPFVEIQKGSQVGSRCKISSHSFICEGVTIEDEVFIGHGVIFTNDLFPRATNDNGTLKSDSDWTCIPTLVRSRAAIGSGSTLLCGITIGEGALVGAGSVVTKNVPDNSVVVGNPARVVRRSNHAA